MSVWGTQAASGQRAGDCWKRAGAGRRHSHDGLNLGDRPLGKGLGVVAGGDQRDPAMGQGGGGYGRPNVGQSGRNCPRCAPGGVQAEHVVFPSAPKYRPGGWVSLKYTPHPSPVGSTLLMSPRLGQHPGGGGRVTLDPGKQEQPFPTAGVPTSLVLLQPAPGLGVGGLACLLAFSLPLWRKQDGQEELSTGAQRGALGKPGCPLSRLGVPGELLRWGADCRGLGCFSGGAV